jgi:hypothetical protein
MKMCNGKGGKGTGAQQSNFGMNMMTSVSRMMKHIASEYYVAFMVCERPWKILRISLQIIQ